MQHATGIDNEKTSSNIAIFTISVLKYDADSDN
jgi:hypothetical protein